MTLKNTNCLPKDPVELSNWFAEGVRDEIEALAKVGGTQNYEVISGQLLNSNFPKQAIYQFILADGSRVPEEATGILKTANEEFSVRVAGQKDNHIRLEIESNQAPPTSIPRAILVIDDTALLRRLEEVLGEIANSSSTISPLATIMFHPEQGIVNTNDLPKSPNIDRVEGEAREALKQASSSSLTYIWGPPGTGKTYTLAHLIAVFVERGERVLITSHTNAAVDQALYETLKPADKEGPLFDHPIVKDGRLLRIRKANDIKIPNSVQLDLILSAKAKELESAIQKLESKVKLIKENRTEIKAQMLEWEKLFACSNSFYSSKDSIELIKEKIIQCEEAIIGWNSLITQRLVNLEKAQKAWLFRKSKIERSKRELLNVEKDRQNGQILYENYKYEERNGKEAISSLQIDLGNQQIICQGLPSFEVLKKVQSDITTELEAIKIEIRSLQDKIEELEKELINEARVIFCTLTKNYIGKEIFGQKFDVVIADEISMALPPLLFLAAGRAISRVVLIGDFLQLPPIIRSDSPISNKRLGTNTFKLAGLASDLEAKDHPVLVKLKTQRRMVPQIAEVARHLVYSKAGGLNDHPDVFKKKPSKWLNFLPESPIVIIDTADLYCWSGKQPGSLSRFNIYSATVAVELAAMAATNIQEPSADISPPIGIVTPYAAQRRLLADLVNEMNLRQWVQPGTVHTFQGGESDLIIFDSVLDEPYYTSRLTNPKEISGVLKDLNVAITRAKFKFVFIGSSEWLNRRAKPLSGLGELWAFLKEKADLVSATEIVELGFMNRIATHTLGINGWKLPQVEDNTNIHEILDESTFYNRFTNDVANAKTSIFGLVPYFGQYRWPRIQPFFSDALARGVEITLVTPPLAEAENRHYVEQAIRNLQKLGAIIVQASGLHGKDIVIDEKIHYTGSLNWASHRGRSEMMHRTASSTVGRKILQYMQAKYIRAASIHENGEPRNCPYCTWPIWIVNQKKQHFFWDFQAMKVGCTNPKCKKYLRNIDERPPFKEPPRCKIDGQTKYRLVKRGKGRIWQCPKHPRECPKEKVVPGDAGLL